MQAIYHGCMGIVQQSITKIKKVIEHPLPLPLVMMQLFPFLTTDSYFLKRLFKAKLGKKLDLSNPQTYNEKLQWLKLNYQKPEMIQIVDKYEVKKYVAQRIGEKYIIPTYGVWPDFESINFQDLPKSFVLKTTHDQGSVIICPDKSKLKIKEAEAFLSDRLRRNYYNWYREWPYKQVPPRLLAEKLIFERDKDLKDYKFYCFHGEIKLICIIRDREDQDRETKRDFYGADLNHLDITIGYEQSGKAFDNLPNYKEMAEVVRKLAAGFPHIRIDLYNDGKQIYFGEMTFYPGAGLKPILPEEWDYKMGSFINLEEIN